MADVIYAGDGGIFKTCSKCGLAKPFSDFNVCKKEKTGLRCECRSCQLGEGLKYRNENLEKERARSRAYYKRHPEMASKRLKEWRESNKERAYKRDSAYSRANREKGNEAARRYYNKKKACPKFRLENAIGVGVHAMLKGEKSYRPTFAMLGYSVEDLKRHLENLFLPGMSWENYGFYGWHVDHIVPRAFFKFTSADDPEFKKAWGLENLQPMWASENKRKGAKLDYGRRKI